MEQVFPIKVEEPEEAKEVVPEKAKRHLKVSRAVKQLIVEENANQMEQLDNILIMGGGAALPE